MAVGNLESLLLLFTVFVVLGLTEMWLIQYVSLTIGNFYVPKKKCKKNYWQFLQLNIEFF